MEGMDNQRTGSRRKDLIPPCKDCGERNPGCHDHCSRYAEYKQRMEQVRAYMKRVEETGEYYDPMAPVRRRYT